MTTLNTSEHPEHVHPQWGVEQIGWIGQSGRVYPLGAQISAADEPGSFSPLYQPRDEECGHVQPDLEAENAGLKQALALALETAGLFKAEGEQVAERLGALAQEARAKGKAAQESTEWRLVGKAYCGMADRIEAALLFPSQSAPESPRRNQ